VCSRYGAVVVTSAVPGWLQIVVACAAVLGGLGTAVALSVLVRDRRRYARDQADRDIGQARGVLTAVVHDEPSRHAWTVVVMNYSVHVVTDGARLSSGKPG